MVTDIEAAIPDEEDLSGYRTEDEFLATRFMQGDRVVYTIDLSIPQLVSTLQRPNPTRQLPGNRKINEAHAKSFASYIRRRRTWVVPPLFLRAPADVLEFEPLKRIGGTDWGLLRIPRLARSDIGIIDGQHRVLGFHIAIEDVAAEINEKRERLARTKKLDDPALCAPIETQLHALQDDRRRLSTERVSAQIVVVDSPDEYKQVFVDIADNALGITRTTRALFDSQKIVHRCLDEVMQHPLLRERVDLDRDRILAQNPALMGAKHVADLIRAVQVGVDGRISRRQETELREEDVVAASMAFFDVLVAAFPDYAAVVSGSLSVPDLRSRSLLGSVTFQRVLAGVYHELMTEKGMNRLQVQRFFESLSAHVAAPVRQGSPWLMYTDEFTEGGVAPGARAQGLRSLTNTIVAWAISPPEWLKAS